MPANPDLRILFAGTPEFAAMPLHGMLDAGIRPMAVLTQPDRPSGRGRRLQHSPVKAAATEAGIEVFQPHDLRDDSAIEQLQTWQPDLMIVVAYGLILPQKVLDIPRLGCWNIHASLLPRWRGAAPIQRAIEAGDAESGVCIMQMDAGLDTGDVIARKSVSIARDETGGSLHDKLAGMGTSLLLQCLAELYPNNPPKATPQDDSAATYANKLSKAEARIDWRQPAALIERKIRAFDPWPVCWCMMGDDRIRVWSSVVIGTAADKSPGSAPGIVVATSADGIDIATGDGVLRILELQPAGKRRMGARDFLASRDLPQMLES